MAKDSGGGSSGSGKHDSNRNGQGKERVVRAVAEFRTSLGRVGRVAAELVVELALRTVPRARVRAIRYAVGEVCAGDGSVDIQARMVGQARFRAALMERESATG